MDTLVVLFFSLCISASSQLYYGRAILFFSKDCARSFCPGRPDGRAVNSTITSFPDLPVLLLYVIMLGFYGVLYNCLLIYYEKYC